MFDRAAITARIIPILAAQAVMFISGCGREAQLLEPLDGGTHEFDIFWPPAAPEAARTHVKQPLLRGSVAITGTTVGDAGRALEIALTITRPSTERDRTYWNSQLSFADLPWMDEVRVWDSDSKWQWPNLPYLLRRFGVERIERYGGVDPGKHVDNDFAAVMIRKFERNGGIESADTRNSPFVSAEWHGDGQEEVDIHSLVHIARSDTFVVHAGRDADHASGKLKLWLIYADFLGSRPPASWPKEREWAGGILAYCEVDWDKPPNQPCRGSVQFLTPPASTGFDWATWSEDLSSPARPRLTNLPN